MTRQVPILSRGELSRTRQVINQRDHRRSRVIPFVSVQPSVADIRSCVLGSALELDPDQEPYPWQWAYTFREVEPVSTIIDDDGTTRLRPYRYRIKEGGWTSQGTLLGEPAESLVRRATNEWESANPCILENAPCTVDVPIASELCAHQSFTPETGFKSGHLRRLPVPVVDSFSPEACFEDFMVVQMRRVPLGVEIDEHPCNPEVAEGTPFTGLIEPPLSFAYMFAALNPLCVVCEDES